MGVLRGFTLRKKGVTKHSGSRGTVSQDPRTIFQDPLTVSECFISVSCDFTVSEYFTVSYIFTVSDDFPKEYQDIGYSFL